MNAQSDRLKKKHEEAVKRKKEREEAFRAEMNKKFMKYVNSESDSDDGKDPPESQEPPRSPSEERDDDLAEFRAAFSNPAAFVPARLPIMCCGRPIVVHWMCLDPLTTTIPSHKSV